MMGAEGSRPNRDKLPFAVGPVVDPSMCGPEETFDVEIPGALLTVKSEKTPDGIKGMKNGDAAQLSVTLSIPGIEELKLSHATYALFLGDPYSAEMQSSLASFANAVNALRKTETLKEGLRALDELNKKMRLISRGNDALLPDLLSR